MGMIFLLVMHFLFASDFTVIEFQATSNESDTAKAKQQMVQNAIEQTSLEYITSVLGVAEADKKKSLIKTKILPQYGKFIPYMKQGEFKRSKLPYSMLVTLHFSRESLRQLLIQEGVLSFSTESFKIIPMISFLDKKQSKSYKWWFLDEDYSKTKVFEEAKFFQENLKQSLWADSFLLVDPIGSDMVRLMPKDFSSISYSMSELQSLGKKLGGNVILHGHVHYGPNPSNSSSFWMSVDLQAMLVSNQRRLATFSKTFESPAGNYDSMEAQYKPEFYKEAMDTFKKSLQEAWQKGIFDSDRIFITLRGSFDYKTYSELKKELAQKSLRIKNLSDRSFFPDSIRLEADVSSGLSMLEKDLASFQFKGKKPKIELESEKELVLDFR